MITLENIDVSFTTVPVLSGLSLHIEEGEFFTLLGPSGCGKTTLLRVISGFVSPDRGRVAIDGQDVTQLAPEDRRIGVVFQNYALFPHLTVFENVAFGLRIAARERKNIGERVHEALQRVGVADQAEKKPAALSGGQQQRVAIARALILGSRVLLLDEPLSNLDAKLRDSMRDEIRDLQQRLRLTAVYVTHDQAEALALSDRIAVMQGGAIRQIGTPFEIYNSPQTPFVCDFVGETSRLPMIEGLSRAETATIYVRPEDVVLGQRDDADWITLQPVLERSVFQGSRMRLVLDLQGHRVLADAPGRFHDTAPGAVVPISVRRSQLHVFPAQAT